MNVHACESDSSLQPRSGLLAADRKPMGLLLCRDLIFTNKIKSTAAELGFLILVADSPEQVSSLIESHQPQVVFVDLMAGDLVGPAALNAYHRLAHSTTWFVAFGPHVDVGMLADAKAAGCQVVLPRSRFTAELPDLMRRYFAEPAVEVTQERP
jgi:CheY-like chemotaxis protein